MRAQFTAQTQQMQQVIDAQKRERAKQVIKRMQHGILIPAFEHWKAYTHEMKNRKRTIMHATLTKLHKNQLWSAWRHWCMYTEHAQTAEMRAHLTHELNEQKRKRGLEVIKRMQHSII